MMELFISAITALGVGILMSTFIQSFISRSNLRAQLAEQIAQRDSTLQGGTAKETPQQREERLAIQSARERQKKFEGKLEELEKEKANYQLLLDEYDPFEGSPLYVTLNDDLNDVNKRIGDLLLQNHSDEQLFTPPVQLPPVNQNIVETFPYKKTPPPPRGGSGQSTAREEGMCPTCASENPMRCGCRELVARTPINGGPPIYPKWVGRESQHATEERLKAEMEATQKQIREELQRQHQPVSPVLQVQNRLASVQNEEMEKILSQLVITEKISKVMRKYPKW